MGNEEPESKDKGDKGGKPVMGAMTIEAKKKILLKYPDNAIKCPVCNGLINAGDDLSDVEYVKTKRKTDIFIHTGCYSNKFWE